MLRHSIPMPLCALFRRSTLARVLAVMLAASPAAPTLAQVNYPDFSNTTGLSLQGAATTFSNRIRLTDAIPAGDVSGNCWYSAEKLRVVDGFDTSFMFRIGDGDGADGLAFILQDVSPTASGGLGGDLGYGGLPRCIAVEVDTWRNNNETTGTHISINSMGVSPNDHGDIAVLAIVQWPVYLRNLSPHTLRVRYVPGTMEVYLDGDTVPLLSAPVTLTNMPGGSIVDAQGKMWAGFGAGTGFFADNHDIYSWSLTTCPGITANPQPQTVCTGTGSSFSVTAVGPGLSYQWRRAGVPLSDGPTGSGSTISGATSATLSISASQPADGASYDCVVTNSCGGKTSTAASLTVSATPSISSHPSSISVCPGAQAVFSVTAGGSPTYQWRKNGSNIGGATTSTLTIASASPPDAASYDCVVTNACGIITSNAAALTVNSAPSISGQPGSTAVCAGSQAVFSVTAGGTPAPTYQWRKNGSNIAGATASTLTIASAAPADAANYDCVVTNTCGNATSSAASLTVNTAPSITSQPSPLTLCSGSNATFTVASSGAPAPSYQWRKNGANITNATNTSLSILAVSAADAANYDCVVTNSCGSATSSIASLSINVAPSVSSQPASTTVCAGSQAVFSVTATATPAPSYQWRKSGASIGGATASTLTISSASASDAASYDCLVTNACGTATSNTATLTVSSAPSITSQPSPLTLCAGTNAAFTVAASGTPAPSYQWRKNATDIPGATSNTLTINSIATSDAASYDCVVTNSCGSATSSAASLAVNTSPSITSHPSPLTLCAGSPATFTVSASGSPAPSYQWRKNATDISGATSSSLTISSVATSDAAGYDCVVTNTCGSVTCSAASLTVNTAPSVVIPPGSITVCAGSQATFALTASGSPAPTYQWRKNGSNISGATASSFTIASATTPDAAIYDCVLTNACASVTSASASLTVNTGPSIVLHPDSTTVVSGGTASFSVVAAGTPPLSYQWRKNTVNLSETPSITGTTTSTVTIHGASFADAGSYTCLVTNACGTSTSNAATLTVNRCPADMDDGTGTGTPDGGVTIDDLLYFLNVFNQGLLAADVDDGSSTGTPDGGVTIEDFLYYLLRFDGGC